MVHLEKKYKFALVSHSIELARMMRQSYDPAAEDVITKVVGMDDAVPTAKRLLDNGMEVILGHGGTGRLILQALGQSVVNMPRTDFDIISAFLKARDYGQRIGFTSFASPTDGIELLESLLDIEVYQLIFNNQKELEEEVRSAYINDINVVVGGGVSRNIMMSLGGRGVIILPRKSVVIEALEEARAIAASRRNEAENIERIKTIIQMADDGVISVKQDGEVDIYNEKTEKILGVHITKNDEKTKEFLANILNVEEVLKGNIREIDMVRKVNGKNMFINTLPVKVKDKIHGAVSFIREAEKIENINRKLKESLYVKGFVAKHHANDIKGKSRKMASLMEKVKKYAKTNATVLIQGETGTGKGLLAEAIHNMSHRRKEPFVAVNCPALPESLLESELFGHEEGAFTGAKKGGKVGLFEMANKGTIYLDEIADIPHSIQVRLLRVVEAKEVMRVGGDRYVPVDVRILTSSNRDLRGEVENGNFRQDLYYRLAFLKVTIPPLRERLDDIPLLVEDLIEKYKGKLTNSCLAMIDRMSQYSWPGNIRELRSFIESYFILLDGSDDNKLNIFQSLFDEHTPQKTNDVDTKAISRHDDLSNEMDNNIAGNSMGGLKEQVSRYERVIINSVLERCNFNKKKAADKLDISVNTLWRKMKAHD